LGSPLRSKLRGIKPVSIKSKLDVDPVSGEEVEKIVAGLFKLDSATVAKMSEILK